MRPVFQERVSILNPLLLPDGPAGAVSLWVHAKPKPQPPFFVKKNGSSMRLPIHRNRRNALKRRVNALPVVGTNYSFAALFSATSHNVPTRFSRASGVR